MATKLEWEILLLQDKFIKELSLIDKNEAKHTMTAFEAAANSKNYKLMLQIMQSLTGVLHNEASLAETLSNITPEMAKTDQNAKYMLFSLYPFLCC